VVVEYERPTLNIARATVRLGAMGLPTMISAWSELCSLIVVVPDILTGGVELGYWDSWSWGLEVGGWVAIDKIDSDASAFWNGRMEEQKRVFMGLFVPTVS